MPFVGDILIAYFVRGLIRLFWQIRSLHWNRKEAVLVGSSLGDSMYPEVHLAFRLRTGNEPRNGVAKIPFLLSSSARKFSRDFSRGTPVIVRVNGKDPLRTLWFGSDQDF
jgi:hypothetical protein